MKKAILILVSILFLAGCVSPVVGREQARNPKCKVSEKSNSGGVVVVEIRCPGELPVERTYHSR